MTKHIPKKWNILVLGAATIATAVYFIYSNRVRLIDETVFWNFNSCSTGAKELLADIKSANYCETHGECVTLDESAVHCINFVNTNERAVLENKIASLVGRCGGREKAAPVWGGEPYLACRSNKCEQAERGEERVIAQTDENEYHLLEKIFITITNDLLVPIQIVDDATADPAFVRLEQKTDAWRDVYEDIKTPPSSLLLYKELKPRESYAYVWSPYFAYGQSPILKLVPGIYRFTFFLDGEKNLRLQTNEFTITDKRGGFQMENLCDKDADCVLSSTDCCPTCNADAVTIWEAERRKNDQFCDTKDYKCIQLQCPYERTIARCLTNQCVKTYEITGQVIETEAVLPSKIRLKYEDGDAGTQRTCNELNRVKIKEAVFGGPEREFVFKKDNRFFIKEGSCYSLEYQKTEDICEGDVIIGLQEKPCVEVSLDKSEYQWNDEIEIKVANNSGTTYWYDNSDGLGHKLILLTLYVDKLPISLASEGNIAIPKELFPGSAIRLPVLQIKKILPSLLSDKERNTFFLKFIYALDTWDTPEIPSAINQYARTNEFTINLEDAPRYYSDNAYCKSNSDCQPVLCNKGGFGVEHSCLNQNAPPCYDSRIMEPVLGEPRPPIECVCVQNKCEEKQVVPISVSTDKDEYIKGEKVTISIANLTNKSQPIHYPYYSITFNDPEDGKTRLLDLGDCESCSTPCSPLPSLTLQPREIKKFTWDQKSSYCDNGARKTKQAPGNFYHAASYTDFPKGTVYTVASDQFSVVSNVVITPSRNEYTRGEELTFTVSNNSDENVWLRFSGNPSYLDPNAGFLEMWDAERESWDIAWEAHIFSTASYEDQKVAPQRARQYYLPLFTFDPGTYRIGMYVNFTIIPETVASGTGQSPHSKPFTIKEKKSIVTDHFIIFHHADDLQKAASIGQEAENAFSSIIQDIPVDKERYQEDWKVKLYVYPDKSLYSRVTMRPSWSNGSVSYRKRMLHLPQAVAEDYAIGHELTHLMHSDLYGGYSFWKNVPEWVTEGLAMYEEEKIDDVYVRSALAPYLAVFKNGDYYSLEELTDKSSVEGISENVRFWYAEGWSIAKFLIQTHGMEKFLAFGKYLGENMNLEKSVPAYPLNEALQEVYNGSFASTGDLLEQWLKQLPLKT